MSASRIEIAPEQRLAFEDARRLMDTSPWTDLEYGDAEIAAVAESAAAANLLVARDAGRVVGFTLSSPGFLVGEYLRVIAVDPGWRRAGVGRLLLSELESRAFARVPNVYLCVSDFNAPARAFYTSLGYEEIGLLRDLLLPGKGEVLMRKTIAAWRPFRRGDAPA
ncbi:MAG: GNAT family N-acetyltransferase [Deltaproteobacteria bacterium]